MNVSLQNVGVASIRLRVGSVNDGRADVERMEATVIQEELAVAGVIGGAKLKKKVRRVNKLVDRWEIESIFAIVCADGSYWRVRDTSAEEAAREAEAKARADVSRMVEDALRPFEES